jgi:excisionase family DNA binding protein
MSAILPDEAAGRRSGRPPHKPEAPLTLSVPEAGAKYFGIGKNASYAAAERGEIPTIKVGKLLRVPVRAMERMLDEAGKGGGIEE